MGLSTFPSTDEFAGFLVAINSITPSTMQLSSCSGRFAPSPCWKPWLGRHLTTSRVGDSLQISEAIGRDGGEVPGFYREMRRATRSWWRLKHEVRRCQKPSSKKWSKISSVLPTWRMRNHPPSRWRRLSQMPWRAGYLESDGDFANALGSQEGPDALQPDQGSWIHLSCAVDLPDGQRNVRLKLFVAGCHAKRRKQSTSHRVQAESSPFNG